MSMQQRQLLQQAALKVTDARLAVLSFLAEQTNPQDAETIYKHVQAEHTAADRATIYRILDVFTDKGLANRLEFGEGKYRYELAGQEHHHLICESCGKIEDISDCHIADLEQEITQKKGFKVKRHSLEFYGVCASCQR